MRVLICGNISWEQEGGSAIPVYDLVLRYKEECEAQPVWTPLVIISGMAPGIDEIAWEVAEHYDVYCDEYPWNDRGLRKALSINPKAAKQTRNQWMLNSGVDVCHGFTRPLNTASGTRDMMSRCVKAGVPTFWHTFENDVYRVLLDPGYKGDFDPDTHLERVK